MTPRWLSRVAAALDVERRRHVADARFYRLLSDSEQGTASDAKQPVVEVWRRPRSRSRVKTQSRRNTDSFEGK
jgi:hypothetical protein